MCFATNRYGELKSYCGDLARSWKKNQKDPACSKDVKSFLQGLSGIRLKPIRSEEQLDGLVAALEFITTQHGGLADRLLSYAVAIIGIAFGVVITVGFASATGELICYAFQLVGCFILLAVILVIVSFAINRFALSERELLSAIRIAQLKGELTIDEPLCASVYTRVTNSKVEQPPALTIGFTFREKVDHYAKERAARHD